MIFTRKFKLIVNFPHTDPHFVSPHSCPLSRWSEATDTWSVLRTQTTAILSAEITPQSLCQTSDRFCIVNNNYKILCGFMVWGYERTSMMTSKNNLGRKMRIYTPMPLSLCNIWFQQSTTSGGVRISRKLAEEFRNY